MDHKFITITYEGNEYVLEYTRKTVERMEQRGFDITQVSSRPMTLLPELFAGAFLANHREVRRDKIDKIFDSIQDRKGLLNCLSDLYNEPLMALIDNDKDADGDQGNVTWKASW